MDNARLRAWYKYGLAHKATHLLVVADILGFYTFPVWVYESDTLLSKVKLYEDSSGHTVLDTYTYTEDFEAQLLEKKRHTYE